jgi:GNAT superfamily N-acetyltransferase
VPWTVRELAAEETHHLRRTVSADGHTGLPGVAHELDAAAGTLHLGADHDGQVVATSSYYLLTCPLRPDVRPAVELKFMAVAPEARGQGIGSAVLAEAVQRLTAAGAALLWAHARTDAVRFYQRFGFTVVPGSDYTPESTGRPHHVIVLDLR